MEQLLTFIANHPILVGAFAVVLAALIATESARMTRRWKELDTAQAILLINRRDPLILDVSNSTDYAKGHILNAENMPPSRIESGNQRLIKSKSRPVLLYDKNGQVSPQMAKRLVQLGFEDVNVLRGGLTQWTADQQPITRGKPGGKPAGKARSGGKTKDRAGGKQRKGGESGKQDRKPRGKNKAGSDKRGHANDGNDQAADDQGANDQGANDQGAKNRGGNDKGGNDKGASDERAGDGALDRAETAEADKRGGRHRGATTGRDGAGD
jgi:rhodanese-related sulfurtransferase